MEKSFKIKPKTALLMKIIAVVMTCIMISQFFPPIVLGMQDIGYQENDNIVQEEIIQDEEKTEEEDNPRIVGEILEKRTLNGKEFLLENGNTLSAVYPFNVHYEENGELLDINNKLQDSSSEQENIQSYSNDESLTSSEEQNTYENKNNFFKIKFSKKANKNNLVQLQLNNNNIKWSLKNSNKVETQKQENSIPTDSEDLTQLQNISSENVLYENILNGINIKYTVVSDNVKEDIILKDKQAKEEEITFEFNLSNLKMEKAENGEIVISEKDSNTPILTIDKPFMYDSKNEVSNDIESILEQKNENKYTLTLKPNQEWLESEEREYPVVIDPTVSSSLNRTDIQDTFIFDQDDTSTTRYNSHILRVGSNNTTGTHKNPTRTLIKFNIPELQAGDQVIKAVLNLCSYPDTDEWEPSSTPIQIDVMTLVNIMILI